MSYQPDAELERRIDDAIEDALPDAAELKKVEARRGELTPEAQADDDAYARDLTDRLELLAARVPLSLDTFRILITAEVERRRTGRRRCAAGELPFLLLTEQADAGLAETNAEVALANAQRVLAAQRERRAIADAVVRAYGSDRRERA